MERTERMYALSGKELHFSYSSNLKKLFSKYKHKLMSSHDRVSSVFLSGV